MLMRKVFNKMHKVADDNNFIQITIHMWMNEIDEPNR